MPIKGLTDKPAQFPEIGRIRKGAPKTEEGYVGKDLTYFRVEFDEKEREATAVFYGTYGEQPTELNILLPFNSVDENFDAWKEAYVAGGLTHRCDGERIWYEVDSKGDPYIVNGEPFKACDGSAGCKPTGRLKVLIPELQRLAFLTVLTTSYHDVMNISRQLEALLQINRRLAGVPLKLRRRPMKISTPSGPDGKRARRIKSLLSIEADPEWVKMKLLEMKIAALPGNGLEIDEFPQLEVPVWEEDSEDEFIEGDIDEIDEEEESESPHEKWDGRRPYPPHIVRERVLERAPSFKGARKDEPRPGGTLVTYIAWQMEECFKGDPKPGGKRIGVLNYIFGPTNSTNDLNGAQLKAIEWWLGPGEYEGAGAGIFPRQEARAEAGAMFAAHLKEQGQKEIEL